MSQEQNKLHSFVCNLSEDDKSGVYNDGLKLLKEQSDEISDSCLPTLTMSGK